MRALLVTHVVLVALGLAYLLAAVATPTQDANIGAGLALLWLGLLGLPWSWPVWDAGGLSSHLLATAVIGSALLNVALHLLLRTVLRRRADGWCGRIRPRG